MSWRPRKRAPGGQLAAVLKALGDSARLRMTPECVPAIAASRADEDILGQARGGEIQLFPASFTTTGETAPLIPVKKVITPQVRRGFRRCVVAVTWASGDGSTGRRAVTVYAAIAGAPARSSDAARWWELAGWLAADAGRSAATGADGSASGRKRRERSEARREPTARAGLAGLGGELCELRDAGAAASALVTVALRRVFGEFGDGGSGYAGQQHAGSFVPGVLGVGPGPAA